MPVYSHSRIVSFETCPLRYKYVYLDRIKPEFEETGESYLGVRVHEALERLYRNIWNGKSLSRKELLAFFRNQWEKNWADAIAIIREDYSSQRYRKLGEKYLKDYYKRYKPFRQGKVVDLEITDFLPLDEEGKYEFYVRIERLMDMGHGLYEIHDYKTNTTLPTQDYLDRDPQLGMYSLWVRREFEDCRDVRLVWHFLALDKEMESYRTKEQLESLQQEILAKIKAIEATTEFPPRVSSFCVWCLYNCPKKATGLEASPKKPS